MDKSNIMYVLLGGVLLGLLYYITNKNKIESFTNNNSLCDKNNTSSDNFYIKKDKLNLNKKDIKIDYNNNKNRQFISYDPLCSNYNNFLKSLSLSNKCKNGIQSDCHKTTPIYYQGKGGVGYLPSGYS